jgi:hypothetical protein
MQWSPPATAGWDTRGAPYSLVVVRRAVRE